MNVLNKLARWAGEMSFEALSPSAVEKAKECIMDVCGVTLAGSGHPAAKIVRECLMQSSDGGPCRVIGTEYRAKAPSAALANAFAAHVWDFDDTCYAGIVHPSAVLFPTVLALGEEGNATGKDILLAFIVGLEIQGKVGEAVSPYLFLKGWFTTGVLGVIGAAAASAKIFQIPIAEVQNAIGLALSQTGGMRQHNGTPAKPYSAALAAENGLLSAQIARKGLSASPDILEGQYGFFHLYCDDQYDDSVFDKLGDPLVILSPGLSFKPHPSCSGTHAAMDAVIALASENRLTWQQVNRIHCRTTPIAVKSLPYNDPANPEQAQFSMPFSLACVLKDGKLELSHLREQKFRDPVIREIMGKVVIEAVETFDLGGTSSAECPEGSEVAIETVDGRTLHKFVGHPRGSPCNPFSKEEQRLKFTSCAKGVIDDHKINRCMELIEKLEFLEDVHILSHCLVP
ncbi:MAG: MmgE/PrpD family protein [Deltaproteobacteria bacterium]|nr:MmgE/PrpD family protein [Deltaproteobacteria bacterium]MBW2308656.1 MmgE/PrpD family protein [Deltaproteobacteria bacterium]